MVRHHLLRQRLVPRQHEAAWIAAGVGDAHQLEVGHHVLVVDRPPVELLQQIKRDMGLPILDGRTNHFQIALDPERLHLMAEFPKGGHDIVFGFPGRPFKVLSVQLVGRDKIFMHQHKHAQSSHSATLCRPLCR